MQEDLPGLARELRKETCPRRVIDGARRRIAAETPPRARLGYAIQIALACGLLVCSLVVWQHLAGGGKRARQPEMAEQQRVHGYRMQVVRQTETALGLIGTVLLDASTQSKTVITDRAIPPLRNGLETAKNKIIRYTELEL